MVPLSKSFDELISEANQAVLAGWDFSFLAGRWVESSLSWDLTARIGARLTPTSRLVDMGTGGGEFLQSLAFLPPETVATEGYAPNVSVATANLEPLGIKVVDVTEGPLLPFADESFDVVMNRHEEYDPAEVRRVLKPGGYFVTQQVGGRDMIGLNELLRDEVKVHYAHWNKEFAVAQCQAAGLQVLEAYEEFSPIHITDIGAVVYMLKATPWQVDDFSAERYYDPLKAMHDMIKTEGKLTIYAHRFFIEAMRPATSK